MKSYSSLIGSHSISEHCGVARFNLRISEKIGVRITDLEDLNNSFSNLKFPLISIHLCETDLIKLEKLSSILKIKSSKYDLFLHDFTENSMSLELLRNAEKIFTGNEEIKSKLEKFSIESKALWSPETITNGSELEIDPNTINFFTFGMAHKLSGKNHYQLQEFLEKSGKSYQFQVSTSPHEGRNFINDCSLLKSEFYEIYRNRFQWCGYLSERFLSQVLVESDFFVAFFESGLRANNSSVIAALQFGKRVITNLDNFSPTWAVPANGIYNLHSISAPDITKEINPQISSQIQNLSASLNWNEFCRELN
jgi:hypothetical protein